MRKLNVRIPKRFLAIFLTFITVMGLFPISTYASDGDENITVAATGSNEKAVAEAEVTHTSKAGGEDAADLAGSTDAGGQGYKYIIGNVQDVHIVTAASIDDQALEIRSVEVESPDEWSRSKLVHIEYEDNAGNGGVSFYISTGEYDSCDDLAAAIGDGTESKAESSLCGSHGGDERYYCISVGEEGTYYIYAVDSSNNFAKHGEVVTIDYIDKEAPAIDLIYAPQAASSAPEYWFTVTDEESGIDSVHVYKSGNDIDDYVNYDESSGNYYFIPDEKADYVIAATDRAGNKEENTIAEDDILYDADAPWINNVTASAKWDDSENTISFKAGDGSGYVSLYYSANEYDTWEALQAAVYSGVASAIAEDSNEEDYEFSVGANGTYYIYAANGNAKFIYAPVEVKYIDNTVPKADKISKDPDTDWHNGTVTIYVEASDGQETGDPDGSGVAKVVYSTLPGADPKTLAAEADYNEDDGSHSFTVEDDFEGTYYVWAIDNVGNVSSRVGIVVNIDKKAPVITSAEYVLEAEKGFLGQAADDEGSSYLNFKDEVYIKVDALDEGLSSGVSGYQYQLAAEGGELDDESWIDAPYSDGEMRLDIGAYDNFTGKVYVRVYDGAGNYSASLACTADSEELTIAVFTGTPVAPDVGAFAVDEQGYWEGYEGEWTNLDVVIKLSSSEPSYKIKEYQYKVVDASESNNNVNSDAGWVTVPKGADGYQIEIAEDTNAAYYFRVVSYADKASGIVSVVVKVQKTAPDNAEAAITGTEGNNGWYVGYPTIEIDEPVVSAYAAPAAAYYTLYNNTAQETVSKGKLSDSNWPEIEEDGRYVLTVWTEDEAGNKCAGTTTIYFNVDTTAPKDLTIEIDGESVAAEGALSGEVSFDAFYDETISVRLAANCDISGRASLQYQKVRSASEYDANGEWIDYDSSTGIVISPSEKFLIYFRAEDRAGNYTIIKSTGIVVDDKIPDIEITPESPNENGYHNGNVSVEISVSDPEYAGQSASSSGCYSGLNTITYRIYTTDTDAVQEGTLFDIAGSAASGAVYDSDGLVVSWSGRITIDGAAFNSNNVRVEITAVDNAGQTRTAATASGEIQIDMTDPAINISYSNNSAENSSYFNADRTATIVITERNFDPSDVEITITNTDGVIPTISGWSKSAGTGNQDNTTWTATVTYSADGDYTFDISFTDLADRQAPSANYGSSVAPAEFTIDKTAPEITVSYDNNDAVNGTYFNASRTANVTIVEHNFDVDGVEFTITAALDGRSIELPAVSWSNNGDVHTAAIVYSYDGDFTFDVAVTDIAGNVSGEADYGSSAAPNEFTVDQTYDNGGEPIIGGVEDGNAYPGEVIPTIDFTDVNYSHYEISLYRTRKNEIDVDITDEKGLRELIAEGSQSISGELDIFSADDDGIYDVDDDGIYTLEVTAYDMAGNEYYDSAAFTVNRFGSVYVYDSYLVFLIEDGGACVQEVAGDLIITEYNASKLVEDSLIIEITRDGRSIDVEYESDPVPNEDVGTGESGWYQYRYAISRDNFTDDGVYYMALSSTDEAGNTPESNADNSTDDGGNAIVDTMQFRVDSTPPEITNITGLEDAIINEREIDVRYTVYDAIGLGSVTVYVNGAVVQTIESFDDLNNYTGSFTMSESGSEQTVRIVVADLAGNTIDTDRFGETDEDGNIIVPMPEYDFNSVVTLSTNFFVRWYADKPLFWGSISAAAAVAGLSWFLAALKRKRKKAA